MLPKWARPGQGGYEPNACKRKHRINCELEAEDKKSEIKNYCFMYGRSKTTGRRGGRRKVVSREGNFLGGSGLP